MPELLYDLSAGFDNTGLVNLQIDTFERMNRLEAGLNIPKLQSIPVPEYKSYIPKDLDGDTIIQKKAIDLPDIKDGLLSADPKIRQAAKQAMAIQAQSNPVTRGVGTTQMVPYTEGQNKFTNDGFFKGKKNTMYGYNPYISLEENENFNHENVWNSYSTLGKVWRGTGLFVGRALSKAVTGIVGMVGDVGSMAWNGLQELGDLADINNGTKNNFWDDVSNNALAREMEKWDNHVKEQWLPTYKALNYDDKGAFAKLFDPYTWTNSFADGAGFLLQFVVPGAMFGKIGQAGRIARSIGVLEEELLAAKAAGDVAKVAQVSKTIAQAKNVSAFTKAMGYDIQNKYAAGLARTLTGSDNVGGMSAHIFNTMLESVAETKEGFNNTVEELMSKGMSRQQAVEIAGENAPGQFWINTAILSISNAFENKLLQKALGNRATTISNKLDDGTLIPTPTEATTKVGKFFQNNAWGNRINFYGKNAIKSSFFEGFWEENAQTAAARWSAGEYERKGDDGGGHEKAAKTWLGQLWNQTQDAIKGNDREAADSIMAGAVIGILGNTVFSKLASTRGEIKDEQGNIIKPKTFLPEGQRKAEKRENVQRVAKFINTRDAWLSIKAFGDDVLNEDGTENPELVKAKTDEIKEKINKVNQVVAKSFTAQNITDPIQREVLQTQLFADYVKAHILNDTGDALVSRLQQWKDKSPNELALYGVTDELTEQAPHWAQKAKELVDNYNTIKDIKYAAPAATTLAEYQNTTAAIHSLIFDYTAQRNMHQDIADKEDLKANDNNPFSDYPLVQDYNQDHVQLLKLQQKLVNENLDAVEREKIQKEIDNIEKKQKERRDTFSTLNDTITLPDGLVLPKDIDKAKESARIAKFEPYFTAINNKIDSQTVAQKFNDLIDMYSNPETGYSAFENQSEYFDNLYNKNADTKVKTDVIDEATKTKNQLIKDKEELKSQLVDAKTKAERDALISQIKDINNKLGIIDEDLDTSDVPPDEDEDTPPPQEVQYGRDDYSDQGLAVDTPFKTANKETIDAKDENTNERIWWKEIALEHGYDHDLTQFARQYLTELQTAPDKYEIFIIKDTIDLMKQRLSKTQLEAFDEGKFTAGAIVVFKEKGQTEYSKFKSGKTIAFSYNKEAFNYNYEERVVANSRKTKREVVDVLAYFEKQQQILEAAREKTIIENAVIPLKSQSGALGVFPTTTPDLAINRFSGFIDNDNLFTIVKPDNKNSIPNAKEGQVYLNIPDSKTVNGKKFYIPVFGSALQKTEGESLQNKIYESVQGIQYTTFKTKKAASDVIRNYLFNFFYLSNENNFTLKSVEGGFKIVYFDEKGEHPNWLLKPKVKLSDKLYNTEAGFSLYEKVGDTFQPTTKVTKEQYRDFIHNHLLTRRKVVVQNIKNKGERIYTEPVNAYLNLSVINEDDVKAGDASQTTAQAIIQPIAPPEVVAQQELDFQIADIEKRRQEELDEFESYRPEENSLLIKQRPNFINYYEGLKQGTTDKFQAKQVRNKINAKYDAELVALKEESVSVSESFVDNLKTKPYIERVDTLIKEGIIDNVSTVWSGRTIIIANIEGQKIPFYKSFSGTGGKTKDKWYPFFGFGKSKVTDTDQDWLIKGSISDLEDNFGSSNIAKYSAILNTLLDWKFKDYQNVVKEQQPLGKTGSITDKEINNILYSSDESGIVNDGEKSIEKAYDIIRKLKAKENITPEQKVIDAFQGKTFTKLKPYTDILQDSKRSLDDKKQVLREISDQMIATGTAEIVSKELGKELLNLIDELGYPAPIENDNIVDGVENLPLEQQIANIKESLKTQTAPVVVSFLEKTLKELETQLEAKKPKQNMTTLEKLRAAINEEDPNISSQSMIVDYNFEGTNFKIDFDNDQMTGFPEDFDNQYAQDFFNSFPENVYTKSSLKINNKDYYFVKHSQSGKFVTFDNNLKFYKVSELPQEVTERSEFKNIENCN